MLAGIGVEARVGLPGLLRAEALGRRHYHIERPSQRNTLQGVVELGEIVAGGLQAQILEEADAKQDAGFRGKARSVIVVQAPRQTEHASLGAAALELPVEGAGDVPMHILYQRRTGLGEEAGALQHPGGSGIEAGRTDLESVLRLPFLACHCIHAGVQHRLVEKAADQQVVGGLVHLLDHSLRIAIVVEGCGHAKGAAFLPPGGIVLRDQNRVVPGHLVFRAAVHQKIVLVEAVEGRE